MTGENTIETNLREGLRQPVRDVAQGFSLDIIRPKGLSYIFNWLLIIFFFLLPLQTRYIFREAPLYEYGTLSVFAVEALGWVVIALFFMETWKQRNRRTKLNKCFLFLVSCFLMIAFLSILWAPDKAVALQAAVRLLEGVLLYVIVAQTFRSESGRSKDLRYIVWSFLASATLQAALGIFQFLTQSTFSSAWLGMAAHDPAVLGTSVVEFGDQRWLRAYGGLPHPNVLGGYLVVALAALMQLMRRHSEARSAEESHTAQHGVGSFAALRMTPFLIGVPLLLTGIFFSFSRAAWVAALIVLMIWLFQACVEKLTIVSFSTQRVLVGLMVIWVVVLGVLYRPLVIARIVPQNAGRLEVKSRVERVQGVREAWALIKQHQLWGVGIGNYTQTVARAVRPNQPLYTYQPVHSVPLLVWTELGIAGLALFLAVLYCIFIQSKPNALVFLCFIVLMTLDHYLWSLPFGILLFWAILGLSTAKNNTPS